MIKSNETRKGTGGEYTKSQLEEMTGPELVSIYNLIADNMQFPNLSKFKDKDTAVTRTWNALGDYQEWLEKDELVVEEKKAEFKFKTREEWLNAAAVILDEKFYKPREYTLPEKLKIGVGFAGGAKAIGVCFNGSVTEDETTHIFICPTQGEEERILDILLHEMIHAHLNLTDTDHKHGPKFRKIALEFGLTGKMTETVVDPESELAKTLKEVASELGPYPHSAIVLKPKAKAATVSKWVGFTSMNDEKYKVDANIDRVIEHGRPRDFAGDPMIATKDEIEMMLLEAGVDPIEEGCDDAA